MTRTDSGVSQNATPMSLRSTTTPLKSDLPIYPKEQGTMTDHLTLPAAPTAKAPDGSDVRVLLATDRAGMAHFEFAPGEVSPAIRHRTIDELWYFTSGRGRMWTSAGDDDGFDVHPGVAVRIPVGTSFQVASHGYSPLAAVGMTVPPWPGDGEAEVVEGPWEPTLEPGPH